MKRNNTSSLAQIKIDFKDKEKNLERELKKIKRTNNVLAKIDTIQDRLKNGSNGIDLRNGDYYSFVRSYDKEKKEVEESNMPHLKEKCSECSSQYPLILQREYDSGPFGDDDHYYYSGFVICPDHGVTDIFSFQESY